MNLIIELTLQHFVSIYADEKSAVVLVSTLNDDVIELTQWFSVNLFTSQ